MSAGLQLRLQRELFDPHGEQLLALVQCVAGGDGGAASGRKGAGTGHSRRIYLCLLMRPHSQFGLAELRSGGGGDDELPKKKREWPLESLAAVDAMGEDDAFALEFDKETSARRWRLVKPDADSHAHTSSTASVGGGWLEEKSRFLSTVLNLSARRGGGSGGGRKVTAVNLPPGVHLVEDQDEAGVNGAKNSEESGAWPILRRDGEGEEYEPISAKEAADLTALMAECDHAVTQADLFAEELSRELSVLDGDNVHSIMASEESVANLMEMLEQAVEHTEAVELRLERYEEQMQHIRDSMDKMEGKTVSIETVNANNKGLLDTLEGLLDKLELSNKYQTALQEADFGQPKKLRECILAARALQRVLQADVDPNLAQMSAVQDQQKRCEKLRERFAKAVLRHLHNLFVHMGNDVDNNLEASGKGLQLKLSRRKHIHRELMRFAELVHWMKDMDAKGFASLQAVYRENLSRLYEKDIRRFFEMARQQVSGGSRPHQVSVAGSSSDLSIKKGAGGGTASMRELSGVAGGSVNLLGADSDSVHSEMSLSEQERFDDVLETALMELEDVCMDEQFFSVNFFRMEQIDLAAQPDPKRVKKVMEEARAMMAEIFPSLEQELVQFISCYERIDSFFTLHALVRLSKHVLSTQDTGSFLAISFGTVLVHIKRNFDSFMKAQLRSIEDARPLSSGRGAGGGNKCGILPFVAKFETFLAKTESIFKNSERRSDLEKWYASLVAQMVASINRVAREHGKTPAEVVKMENFHHLHSLLAQTKIAALDQQKKEMKQRYKDAQRAYVTQYFGRPLEKLNVFFEGIQQLVATGIKESEISYQLAFSKQELRKVIAIYPGREVRKGLDHLYKKVERHLCEEEGLTQVVWRAMQEEFITQYKNIEDLIQRCYPGAQISLDFSIDEVLQFFSDIARSH